MAINRFDILRQGFMKPRETQGAPAVPPEIVACDDCLNWHPRGKHTADAAMRKANRDRAKAQAAAPGKFLGGMVKCPRWCKPAPQAALGMERGEWWLDESGSATFADGDVGDMNHETEAFRAALQLDEDNEDDDTILGTWATAGKISPAQARVLQARGVNPKALAFFQQRGNDARDYAIQTMGWTRVKNTNFEVWVLDDERLRGIQRADFWDEGDEDSETEAFVEERSTGKTWSIPFKTLLGAQTAEGLKRYMDGAGKFR